MQVNNSFASKKPCANKTEERIIRNMKNITGGISVPPVSAQIAGALYWITCQNGGNNHIVARPKAIIKILSKMWNNSIAPRTLRKYFLLLEKEGCFKRKVFRIKISRGRWIMSPIHFFLTGKFFALIHRLRYIFSRGFKKAIKKAQKRINIEIPRPKVKGISEEYQKMMQEILDRVKRHKIKTVEVYNGPSSIKEIFSKISG